MKVRLVSRTQVEPEYVDYLKNELGIPEEFEEVIKNPEGLMAYCARVSSPQQTNPKYAKLLKYCADNKHWSVFELADVTFEIETSRGIAPQILRHKSFSFQEFSQRYSSVDSNSVELYQLRAQDNKNRQNSLDIFSNQEKQQFIDDQQEVWNFCYNKYKKWLDKGAAKECARTLLPLGTKTRLFIKGSLRSWIHYLSTRNEKATQKEHQEIAQEIQKILSDKFPVLAEACGWKYD